MGSKLRLEDSLESRIEAVVYRGHAFIEWWELNLWYEAERITKTIWQDLEDRFRDVTERSDAKLSYFEAGSGMFLVDDKEIKKVSSKY